MGLFSRKKHEGETTEAPKLPKPVEMPEPVGRHLVVTMRQDPDWVWGLRGVVRPRSEIRTHLDVRIFNEGQAASSGVRVRDYTSLDSHPELILFEGWFDKKSGKVELMDKRPPKPGAKAA